MADKDPPSTLSAANVNCQSDAAVGQLVPACLQLTFTGHSKLYMQYMHMNSLKV